MCEPVSIAIVGGSLLGGYMSGKANEEAAQANADAARRNAEQAEQAASDALQRGERDAGKVVMKGEQTKGEARAALGASGTLVDSGSAADVVESVDTVTAMDAETIRNNAQREAWGLKTQAFNLRKEAETQDKIADNAVMNGIIGGLTSGGINLLGGLKTGGAPKAPGK